MVVQHSGSDARCDNVIGEARPETTSPHTTPATTRDRDDDEHNVARPGTAPGASSSDTTTSSSGPHGAHGPAASSISAHAYPPVCKDDKSSAVETSSSPNPRHARTTSLDRTNAPDSISMPSVPPLDPTDIPWDTNTLALLLPHQALFAPEALQLLHDAFGAYGTLAHWAPVRAMGRVIIVYTDDHAAELAKHDADGLALHVDFDKEEEGVKEKEYFSHGKKRSPNDIILRVYALPRTPLDATTDHLRPPEVERNFLISPPGSPPEGWEPILEDGPNMAPLADDLRRALEALQLAGLRRGGREVILDEGGVRVEVEDADKKEESWDDKDNDREWGEEEVQGGGSSIWSVPTQEKESTTPTSFPVLDFGGLGERRGPLTPSGRIMPTARPPMPS